MIDAALAVAGKVAEHANLYLRRSTELDAMLRVQNMLGTAFDVVKPSRKLLKVISRSLLPFVVPLLFKSFKNTVRRGGTGQWR